MTTYFTLTEQEVSTIVSSYEWLIELAEDTGFPMREEELKLYGRLWNLLHPRATIVPEPPADPHREEDPYVPNVSE